MAVSKLLLLLQALPKNKSCTELYLHQNGLTPAHAGELAAALALGGQVSGSFASSNCGVCFDGEWPLYAVEVGAAR